MFRRQPINICLSYIMFDGLVSFCSLKSFNNREKQKFQFHKFFSLLIILLFLIIINSCITFSF